MELTLNHSIRILLSIVLIFIMIVPAVGATAAGFALPETGTIERPGSDGRFDALESGAVAGQVTDAETGLSLPGASVHIDGTAIGAATDHEGRYRISNAPEGDQVLVVSFIGYTSARVPVTILSGSVVTQDVALTLDVIEGGEVLILAQAEGQVKAINQQLASNTIVNVVSAASIQELPDVNAAESVGRLPGVSLIRNAGEGQNVVIRGLSPKYNNVLVNGQQLPSTSFSNRSTDLSMISSNMLSGIEVVKALTPDQDADMIGGTVNFRLLDAPDGFHSDVRLQAGYSGQQETMGFYKGNVNVSQRFFGNRLGVIAQGNLERADRGSDVFGASYNRENVILEEGEQQIFRINGLNLTDRAETRYRYGGSLILDYRLPFGRLQFSNFGSRLDRDEALFRKSYGVGGRSVSYGIRDRDITVDVMANTMQGELNLAGTLVDFSASHSVAHHERPYDNEFTFQEVGAFNEDLILDKGPAVIPRSAKNRPEETFMQWGDHYAVENLERDYNAGLNAKTPFALGRKITGHTKVGGKFRSKRRANENARWFLPYYYGNGPDYIREAFPEVEFVSTSQGRLALTNFLNAGYDGTGFLDGQYDISAALDRKMMAEVFERVRSRYFETPFASTADFDMKEDVTAGYAMMELNLGRRLMILPGVRYEKTRTEYDAKKGVSDNARSEIGFFADTSSTQSFDHWMPIIHLRYRATNWADVRLARTRSLSRPDYTDYSPRERIRSGSANNVDRGNPALRPASSLNYDAILSIYPPRVGLLTFGAFYKEIDDVIYERESTILNPDSLNLPAYTRGSRLSEPINNSYTTTVKGYEVEWQTHFTYLPGLLNGLVLNVNYARIFSETRYPRTILRRAPTPPFRQTEIDTFRVGRMINQPAHVANLSIGYDRGGFSGRISMLYQQSSLRGVGDFPESDSFTDTYIRWDAMVQQRVGRNLSVYLNLNNLNDRPDVSSIGIGFPTSQQYYGWTADVGVRYRF